MTKTHVHTPWETTLAYETHYAQTRERVAKLLEEWGSHNSNVWPEFARFVRIGEPHLTHAWFNQIVHIGRCSINKSIAGWRLQELFPQWKWDESTHDVWFIEVVDGNVHVAGKEPRRLAGYILGPTYVRVVELGCDHPNKTQRVAGNLYTRYQCPDCGHEWGVDTSG